MKQLFYLLIAFSVSFMFMPKGLNAQCTVPVFPFVDQSPTGWFAQYQEQGYDVTTDVNGDIYAVGMTYKNGIASEITV